MAVNSKNKRSRSLGTKM